MDPNFFARNAKKILVAMLVILLIIIFFLMVIYPFLQPSLPKQFQ